MKRAQTFTIDLVLGLLITILALTSVMLLLVRNDPPLAADARRIELLMTEGVPSEWNSSNVQVVGFLTDGRFNRTKIMAFASLSEQEQREALGVRNIMTIRFKRGGYLDLCDTCGTAPATYEDMLPIDHYAILYHNVTTMEVRLYR